MSIGLRITVSLIIGTALVLGAVHPTQAQDYIQVYQYPVIKPELTLRGGYGFVVTNGSTRAAKYRYLKNSPLGGATLVAFPFPHRAYLELDVLNRNDYFMDARYAYKDILIMRWLNSTVFHNLDNITLLDLDPGGGLLEVLVQDGGFNYNLRTSLNKFFVRAKTPDFPFHVFFQGRLVDREGPVQKRYFFRDPDPTRASRLRNVDWSTIDYTAGVNSHLGPVEAEYSHSEKRFEARADRFLLDAFSGVLPAGMYPHSLVPETKGSTNTVKLHTTMTGQIVAGMTLSKTDRSNRQSGANADYLLGAGNLRWMPVPSITVNVKYRHQERSFRNPSSLSDAYYGLSTVPTAIAGIKSSLSSISDTLRGNVRLRVAKGFTLHGGYLYKHTDRTNYALWNVPPATSENSFRLAADFRVAKKLKLRGRYEYSNISSPEFPSIPEKSHEGRLSATYTACKWLLAYASYSVKYGNSDNIVIQTNATGDRTSRSDTAMGNLTFLIAKGVALNAGYSFAQHYVRQDNIYGGLPPVPDVRFADRAMSFMASAAWSPDDKLDVSAGVVHTRSRGDFINSSNDLGSFSKLDIHETVYTASADYKLPKGWEVGVKYEFSDFNNVIVNSESPEVPDGKAQFIYLTFAKKF